MGDITLRFDIPGFTLDYVGSSPSKLIKKLPGIVKDTLKVSSSGFYEDEVKMDVTGRNNEFKASWRAKYDESNDQFTTAWISVGIEGRESKETKEGNITIKIGGFVEVKMPYESSLQKFVRTIYLKTFYGDQIRKYIQKTKEGIKMLDTEIRKTLGISVIRE